MKAGRWRWLGVPAALAVLGVLLALPGPGRRGSAPTGPGASTDSALPSLASVWPAARPVPLPAPADSSTFQPELVLSPTSAAGVVTSPDGRRTGLVVASADGRLQVVQSATKGLFQGVVFAAGRLYWMLTAPDATGRAAVGLWSAVPDGGSPALVTSDVGLPLLPGSGHRLQVAAGRLYWTATASGGTQAGPPRGPTQLRSVPLAGGPVEVRTVPGVWTTSRWPWLVTAPDVDAPPGRYDVDRGVVETVAAAPGYRRVSCGPVWCLAVGDAGTDLVRPDGADPRRLGDAATQPATGEVALLDRFVPLLVPAGAAQRLVLYDIAAARSVGVAPAVTGTGGDGRYLWWSTGDHEARRWYGLDLAGLR